MGSDHFPVYGKFQYAPAADLIHETPEATQKDHAQATEKIEAADPIQKS